MSDFLNQFAANTSGLPGTYKELAALARDRNEARMAACEFGQTVGAATGFELDLQSGQLELIFAGREVAVVSAQVAGTLGDEGMFMWAWGHPSVPLPMQTAAWAVQGFASANQIEQLLSRTVAGTPKRARDFAAITALLSGADGTFMGSFGSSQVYVAYYLNDTPEEG